MYAFVLTGRVVLSSVICSCLTLGSLSPSPASLASSAAARFLTSVIYFCHFPPGHFLLSATSHPALFLVNTFSLSLALTFPLFHPPSFFGACWGGGSNNLLSNLGLICALRGADGSRHNEGMVNTRKGQREMDRRKYMHVCKHADRWAPLLSARGQLERRERLFFFHFFRSRLASKWRA